MKISVVIATYNEERHIRGCLEGLLKQRDVNSDFEVLVIDGGSRDGTRDIIRTFPEFGSRIRVIDNPRKLQVFAWNLGIAHARGEYVALMSAHAHYSVSYLASCLEVIERTGATAVGGVQSPCGQAPVARVIAWCMSSPFGVGNARFRYAKDEEEAESVFGIFTKRQTLIDVGGFDERIHFDEDAELNYRLRDAGAKLIVSPRIGVTYFVRDSLPALGRQMYAYGYWRRRTQLVHPKKIPLRVYAPAALTADVVLGLALWASPLRWLSWFVAGAYGIFVLSATVVALPKLRAGAMLVPPALITMHFSYGIGWWISFAQTLLSPRMSARRVDPPTIQP